MSKPSPSRPVAPPTTPEPATVAADWTVKDSRDLYRLDAWGNGFFGVNDAGEVTVKLRNEEEQAEVSLMQILRSLRKKSKNFHLPALFRFPDLLYARIAELHAAFKEAMTSQGYLGKYCGVYPIKVNQQQQVVAEITEYGRKHH